MKLFISIVGSPYGNAIVFGLLCLVNKTGHSWQDALMASALAYGLICAASNVLTSVIGLPMMLKLFFAWRAGKQRLNA